MCFNYNRPKSHTFAFSFEDDAVHGGSQASGDCQAGPGPHGGDVSSGLLTRIAGAAWSGSLTGHQHHRRYPAGDEGHLHT